MGRLSRYWIINTNIPAWKVNDELSEILYKEDPDDYPYLRKLYEKLDKISELF